MSNVFRRQGWRWWHALTATGLILAAVALTIDAWRDIFSIALNDQEQSQILLVPIVACWMVWVRRWRIRGCTPSPGWVGPVIVAFGWAGWSFGYSFGWQSFWHLGAVLMVLGAGLTALGSNVLIRFLPAFAVLVLLVPVPGFLREHVSLPLQTAVAAGTHAALETLGVPVERSGNVLTVNNTSVAVAEACNGMRFVFALMVVSYTFAFALPLRWHVRTVVLVASPVVALLCNWIRLIPTLLFYGYADRRFADVFHDISGWLMLPVAFLVLLGVVRALRWAMVPVTRYTLAYQ